MADVQIQQTPETGSGGGWVWGLGVGGGAHLHPQVGRAGDAPVVPAAGEPAAVWPS